MSEHSDSFIDALNGTGKFGPPLKIMELKTTKVASPHGSCDCVPCLLRRGFTREQIAEQGWLELEALSGMKLKRSSDG